MADHSAYHHYQTGCGYKFRNGWYAWSDSRVEHFFQLGLYTVDILGAKKIEIETSIFTAKIDHNRSFFQK